MIDVDFIRRLMDYVWLMDLHRVSIGRAHITFSKVNFSIVIFSFAVVNENKQLAKDFFNIRSQIVN